jgi:peptide/nickel transport system substrate-binding protein
VFTRRSFLRLSGILSTSAALAACGTDSTTGTVPTTILSSPAPTPSPLPVAIPTGTLRVAFEVPIQLDPANATTDSEIAILNALYDYLIDIGSDNSILPRLAVEWVISDDGLNYTFTLAPDQFFHDGTPLTAADVVWTFNRLRDASKEFPTADLYSNIVDVKANGPNEVTFVLKQTNPFFLYDLSDNHALIVKAETQDFGTVFNGTGPFKLGTYEREERMTLMANEQYFQPGLPGVATLEFIFINDQVARVAALRSGEIDLMLGMATPLFQEIEQDPALQAIAIPTNGFDLVRLRADRAPGDNPLVMQAMKLATDRQAIFRAVTQELGAIGRDSPIGPLFSAYYSEAFPLPERDPTKARELLAEAGYPDGLTIDCHVPDSGDRPKLGELLKEQWAEAGLNINVIVDPESVYYGDNGWLEVDLGITGWGSRPIPQFYLDVMLVSGAKWNESHFADPEFDELARTAGITLNEAERVAAYEAIQRILIERGPLIIPYFFAQLGAIRSNFEGFALKAFVGRTDLAAIRVKG